MTFQYFQEQMGRLRTEYGAKAFTPGREEIIYKAVRSLEPYQFEKICSHMISTQRIAPLPKDFVEAAMRERHHTGQQAQSPPYVVVCEWCNDGGIIEVMHKLSGEEYFARCGCTFGRDSIHRSLERFEWTGHMSNKFLLHKMAGERSERWKSCSFNPNSASDSLAAIRELWNAKLRRSAAFWNESSSGDGGAA